jgi:hypothetical protein
VTARNGAIPLVVVAVALLVETQSAGAPAHAKDAVARDGAPQVTAAKRRRHRRPGCNKFCHQAGGFGPCAFINGKHVCSRARHPVKIRSRIVRVGRFGIIGIRATCRRKRKCVGAMVVDGHLAYGRANLRIPAHETRVVRVAVTRKGRRYLRHHGGDRHALAKAFLNESDTFSVRRITLFPHDRED